MSALIDKLMDAVETTELDRPDDLVASAVALLALAARSRTGRYAAGH
jgi:hypothetical protein